jgi:hypothetical protein
MPAQEVSMSVNRVLARAEFATTRAHLWTLRKNLTEARDALMHFKADRVDRDRLEPAARRVDDLMTMFGGDRPDCDQGARWLAEIQDGLGGVTNPKAAEALAEARSDITTLLEVMGTTRQTSQSFYSATLRGNT